MTTGIAVAAGSGGGAGNVGAGVGVTSRATTVRVVEHVTAAARIKAVSAAPPSALLMLAGA